MALAPGTRLGPYEIVGRLGSGGMSAVYRARDPRLGREVAVELVGGADPPSPSRLRRFETEARAAAQLLHPNIVTVFDVGTHEGHPLLVLELLEGATLREVLRAGTPIPSQATLWALEAARGLGAAHARGIVHGDFKPENAFLTRDGWVKVVNFGLARLHEPFVSATADPESPTSAQDTMPGLRLGRVGYRSPEQIRGQIPGPRGDVFALGAVLYELVSGRPPFSGGMPAEILAAILRDEPRPLVSEGEAVPAGLRAVVGRCLEKDPGARYPTAREVAEALGAVHAALEPTRKTGAQPREPKADPARSSPR
jgi:serine/threonine protein kinase